MVLVLQKLLLSLMIFLREGRVLLQSKLQSFAVAAHRSSGVKPDFDSFTVKFQDILHVFALECPFTLSCLSRVKQKGSC